MLEFKSADLSCVEILWRREEKILIYTLTKGKMGVGGCNLHPHICHQEVVSLMAAAAGIP